MQSGRVFFPEIYWENDGWLPFFHHYSEKNPTEETHKQPAHKKIGVAVLLLATYNTPDGLWGRKILIWNNRRRAPTALLMQQRCIEMDLEKIIAIIGLFPSFSIANIIYRVFSNLPLEKAYCGYDFFQIQFYTLLHQQCSGRSSSIIRSWACPYYVLHRV